MGTDLARASPGDGHVTEPPSSLPPTSTQPLRAGGPRPLARTRPLAPAGPALTEVSQFQLSPLANEQVLRFQVTVQDFAAVAVGKAPEQLEHENLREEGMRKVSSGRRVCPAWENLYFCPMAWVGRAVCAVRSLGS